MSVTDRKRDKPSAFAQLVRTFFQSYDESNPPDRIALIRDLPGGSIVAFFTEQTLWRTQRNLFGITLMEIKRLLELAKGESEALRAQMRELNAEIARVRTLLQQ